MLKKDNEYGAKKITPKLIELFEAARGGVKDTRIKDHATLLAVCDALDTSRYIRIRVSCRIHAGYIRIRILITNPPKFDNKPPRAHVWCSS